ncbi:MAG TPA: class I SAM-dependent methyltransferase [Thermoanaerobaculia bacterium]|nr:class I SAM-dependent methyltransferase [Thermoanaerobaculia bacterium]
MPDLPVLEHYQRLSAAYDEGRNRRFFRAALARYLDCLGPAPGRVLEVGCGTGGYLAELGRRGVPVHGVDISPAMCALAQQKLEVLGLPGASLVRCADVHEGTGFDEPFDTAVIMDSWEVLARPERVIGVLHRALGEGGRLVLFTPNQGCRHLLTALEVLRIKKLRPAFQYRNSAVGRVLAATAPGFELRRRGTLFLGLERWFVFDRRPWRGQEA